MEHLGISRGVVIQPMAHGYNNSVTLDAIASSNGRLLGVAKIDDSFSDKEIDELHVGGIRGVRFNMIPESGGTRNLRLIERTVEKIKDHDWSLTIHTKPEQLINNAEWLAGLGVPTIIDHYARVNYADGIEQNAFQTLLRLLQDNEHIWAKLSCVERCSALGPPYEDALEFAHAMVDLTPNKLLWGTDWPHSQRYNLGDQCDTGELVDIIPNLIPDQSARRLILAENPLKLFDFCK